MNATQEKIIFDTEKCQTQRRGATDLFDCLVEKQNLICGYALPFGNGQFCKHPTRREFAERSPGNKPHNPSHSDAME